MLSLVAVHIQAYKEMSASVSGTDNTELLTHAGVPTGHLEQV